MSTAPHFDDRRRRLLARSLSGARRMRREAPIAFVPQLGSTLLTRRDDIFVSEKRIDVFSSRPARRPDDPADGPQHDAQGRRRAHGGALDLLSRRVAEGGAGALARRIPGARGSHPGWIERGRARRPAGGVRAAAVGRVPQVDHRADQHPLLRDGCLVAGDDRRASRTTPAIRRSRRAATRRPPGSMRRSTTCCPWCARRRTIRCSA